MGKDLKIKHSVTSPPKKALHEGTNFFGQIFLGMFYMGTNNQIMQGGSLMVKRFRRLSQVSFSSHWRDLDYWYIIWKVNTTNRGLNLKNNFWTLCLWGWSFRVKSVFFFKKYTGDLFFDVLLIGLFGEVS